VIESEGGQVVGFGLMHRYHPSEAFDRVAELTYFILPSHIRKGLGTQLLNLLFEQASKIGVDTLLASISSTNQISLDFHRKHGFRECGRFLRVGKKFEKDFDVIYMQKHL
jgi:L-amino acid N-acyltransferase YncA